MKMEKGKELTNESGIIGINLFLDTDEQLVSEEERLQMDARIEKHQQELIVCQANFDMWYDKITRRIFALARLRKLSKAHTNRIKFYDTVKGQLEKKTSILEVNGVEFWEESHISKSVSRNTVNTSLKFDSPTTTTDSDSILSSVDSKCKASITVSETQGRETGGRMISASDTTIDSRSDEFENAEVNISDDLNMRRMSQKEMTPFIDEVIYKA